MKKDLSDAAMQELLVQYEEELRGLIRERLEIYDQLGCENVPVWRKSLLSRKITELDQAMSNTERDFRHIPKDQREAVRRKVFCELHVGKE